MTETPEGPQYREPGVRYRRVKREYPVTTVIDGRESTHMEERWVDEPVPPRDWDAIVLRGVIGLAVFLTVLAFIGTSASVGGLFEKKLPAVIAYLLGLVFTASWLGCLGLEWLDGRIDPTRAKPARIVGWVFLAIGMSAVFLYFNSYDLPWVGAVGACVDLVAKGFWALLIRRSQVQLGKGVANWVRDQEQQVAGLALVAQRIRGLYRREAYERAVGGRSYQAAQALTTAATPPMVLPAADTSGHDREVSEPVPGQADTSSAPVPPPSAPTPPAAPVPPPAAPTPQPAAPTPPVTPAGTGTSGSSQQQGAQGKALRPVGPPSIAQTIRDVLSTEPKISDADLIDRVKAIHGDGGDPVKFAATVTRTRHRIENPRPKRTA
ncbi:hypothetical protein [Streptomyces sp. NPDC056291]|uniref:hypothetical protein n=1 Tax=Streptomyces sp. NPDC056291 TaxID=3345772 RepID=UPI0035D8A274